MLWQDQCVQLPLTQVYDNEGLKQWITHWLYWQIQWRLFKCNTRLELILTNHDNQNDQVGLGFLLK